MRRQLWARRIRNGSFGLLAVAIAVALVSPSSADDGVGSAGTNTALPNTDSKVTISGRGAFSDLEITVNQTKDLVNQAVSVTWSGGVPTPQKFTENYLQIMQCWGEPDARVPDNPGPPPEQCVQGATNAVPGGRPSALQFPTVGGFALDRIISRRDFPNADEAIADGGVLEEETGYVWRSFRSVKGVVTTNHIAPQFDSTADGEEYWRNSSFDVATTNEIAGARTRKDGTGEELFEVATGQQNDGLGCGQAVEPVPGGSPRVPKCWLVVVPRGSGAAENEGTGLDGSEGVLTSPLSAAVWKQRIAIPLEFNPITSACDIAKEPRLVGGSELVQAAIQSWQPPLCATPGLPPYIYGTLGDRTARRQLLTGETGSPGMIVVSRPIDPTTTDVSNPVVYAPLTVSGLTVGFNVERVPKSGAPAEENALAGIRVEQLNLTPRLVAKLLSQSYKDQTAIGGDPGYEWVKANPRQLSDDPDFLAFNPEFRLFQSNQHRNFGGLVLPAGVTDAARQVWEWILADPEARAWLDGQPDEFGMKVNPVYGTTASSNATGIPFGEPVPESFPKSDPYCYQAPPQGPNGSVIPPVLCGTDWMPFVNSYTAAARVVRTSDDGARIARDPLALSAAGVWKKDGPQALGTRAMLGMVDTPHAATFGLQSARLSRAGDNGDDRTFIAPTEAGLTAGVAAMKPGAVANVLEPDPKVDAPGAYPLTTLTYAAITPLALEAQARTEYAAFVAYAVGDGQVPGLKVGHLPPGYAPLPPTLQAQAKDAAKQITDLKSLAEDGGSDDGGGTDGGTGGALSGLGTDNSTTSRSSSGSGSTPALVDTTPTSLPGESEPSESVGPLMKTAVLALAGNRFVLPALALIALLSALGATEITRRPGTVAPVAAAEPTEGGS